MELCFAEKPSQTEQETIIVIARIVDALGICNEGADDGCQIQQGIPIGIVAGEAARFIRQDQTNFPKRNSGNQTLESRTLTILS